MMSQTIQTTSRYVFGFLTSLLLWPTLSFGGGLHPVPVPPVDELEVLDPRVDPEGKPRAIMVPQPDGSQRVEIPPTIIVHKLYYTGDRSFQGPLLAGGPTILVVSHPRTNEQMYVDVQLLPGIPIVRYFHDCIVYDYGHQVTVIKFGLCGDPHVVVMTGHEWRKGIKKTVKHVAKTGAEWVKRTGVPHVVTTVGQRVGGACMTSADRIHDVGSFVVAPVARTMDRLPIKSLLSGSPEDRAEHLRNANVIRTSPSLDGFGPSIRTLR